MNIKLIRDETRFLRGESDYICWMDSTEEGAFFIRRGKTFIKLFNFISLSRFFKKNKCLYGFSKLCQLRKCSQILMFPEYLYKIQSNKLFETIFFCQSISIDFFMNFQILITAWNCFHFNFPDLEFTEFNGSIRN